MINNKNYIVISGFMRNELNLSGNELFIYAIIFGFSQEENNEFTGSVQYLADWIGATKRTVYNVLNSLCEKQYILKTEYLKNNIKYCSYAINKTILKGSENISLGSEKISQPGENVSRGSEKISQNREKISPNNIYNINDNIVNKKDKPVRHKHGEYKNVLLSDQDLEKLKTEFPKDYQKRIDNLSYYLKSTGKTYKNHLATLRNWARRDKQKAAQQQPTKQNYIDGDLPF